MATSGTYTFNLDLGDVMEEAYERCGLELRSGFDYRTARRSLNLLMLDWQNRGLSLWTVKGATETLTPGQGAYPLTSEKLEKRRQMKKDEEREVPDPRESIEETPAIIFHPVSSKSDFREPRFEQNTELLV